VFTASHLFAALVQGTDSQLQNHLRDKGVQPEKLASLFTAALGIEVPTCPREVSASSSTRELLVGAVQQARNAGRDAAEELDLLRSLVRIKTASVWRILREVGIRPRDLDPDGGTFEIETIGPLTRDDCDSRAWAVLCSAAALADREGAGVAGSPHLFSALLAAPDGALPAAFSRLQIPIDPLLKTIDGKLPTAGLATNPVLSARSGGVDACAGDGGGCDSPDHGIGPSRCVHRIRGRRRRRILAKPWNRPA
jgi:ATP-dependent Clp protease ATP-binding subunit ClpA